MTPDTFYMVIHTQEIPIRDADGNYLGTEKVTSIHPDWFESADEALDIACLDYYPEDQLPFEIHRVDKYWGKIADVTVRTIEARNELLRSRGDGTIDMEMCLG